MNMLLDKIEAEISNLDNKKERTAVDENLIYSFQAARDKLIKYYNKTNWIYCVVLILDPRHKKETFALTVWGKHLEKTSIAKFEDMYKSKYYKPSLSLRADSHCHGADIEVDEEDVLDLKALFSNKMPQYSDNS